MGEGLAPASSDNEEEKPPVIPFTPFVPSDDGAKPPVIPHNKK